jgi:hypothetical protein
MRLLAELARGICDRQKLLSVLKWKPAKLEAVVERMHGLIHESAAQLELGARQWDRWCRWNDGLQLQWFFPRQQRQVDAFRTHARMRVSFAKMVRCVGLRTDLFATLGELDQLVLSSLIYSDICKEKVKPPADLSGLDGRARNVEAILRAAREGVDFNQLPATIGCAGDYIVSSLMQLRELVSPQKRKPK